MTPDATAAKEIAGYYNDHHPDNIATIAAAIREAYAEREAAVAELVRQAKLAATRLMRAYLDVRDLNEAIGAVDKAP